MGITRAESLCTISFAGNRRVFGQWQSSLPSRFIDEMPADHVEVLTPPGLYGGGYGAVGMNSSLEEEAMAADGYDSPGWKRLQSNSKRSMLGQPKDIKNLIIDATASSIFEVGDRVFHQKFGYGNIQDIEGDKLQIEFDKAGNKKVVQVYRFG